MPEHFSFESDGESFAVNTEKRTITGLAVPYGPVASKMGRKFRFHKGSLKTTELSRNKMLEDHDSREVIGVLIKATDTDKGMLATYRIARTPEGDRALLLAEDRIKDGLSVGVDFDADGEGLILADDGVYDVYSAAWRETSLTAMPAFDDARLTRVNATSDQGDSTMTDATPNPAVAPDLSLLADAIAAGFANLPAPEVIPVAAATFVSEPLPYNFHGGEAPYSFSKDLISSVKSNDGTATERLSKVLSAQFAVTQTTNDVDSLNPSQNRPDMHVGVTPFDYPIWATINKGGLSDNTPFYFPKFLSSSGLVAPHVEGVEPTSGDFRTTSQTVEPSALSGKITIRREVWDQGGNPRLDGLLWNEFNRAYYEGLEADTAAFLASQAALIADEDMTALATPQAVGDNLTAILASLQYTRGGSRFRKFFASHRLFTQLATARDDDGRLMFPLVAPTNTAGSMTGDLGTLFVGNLAIRPAWTLQPVTASSWFFDPAVVHGWASAPSRFTMDNLSIADVHLGIFGYKAFAISDFVFIRQILR